MRRISSFMPDSLNIQTDEPNERIGLQFGFKDEFVELVFPRSAVGPLFESILKAARAELPKPIEAEQLAGPVLPQGHDVMSLPDGNVALSIHLRTDDGMRTLTFSMPSKSARDLAAQLNEHARD